MSGKKKAKRCEHELPLHAIETEFSERIKALLIEWVTSKRTDGRWMTDPERALFDEGMKLVPPRVYVAREVKP